MKGYLLDIDGTTLLGESALPGAVAFIGALRAREIPFLWVTNNTSLSKASWVARLESAGLEPQADDVYTAGDATIDFLAGLEPTPRVFLVGTEDLREAFVQAGIPLGSDDAEAVVLGYDTELTYEKIRTAALLLQQGLPFYATHPDMTCPTPAGPIPDVGSFLAMFEAACGRTPQVIGKPQPTMARGALARLGVDAEDAMMVGDRLETDIRMAQAVGMSRCLVLTGVTSGEAVSGAATPPTHIVSSLEELLERLPAS
jgi:HAD superfamily hydrolase (TIGR01457 family)